MNISDMGLCIKKASELLATTSTDERNNALFHIAEALEKNADAIITANDLDIKRSMQENISQPLLKRLTFNKAKIDEAVNGLKSLAALSDPIGKTLMATKLDEELELYKVSCPIGVIGVIFESRPDALVQISCLCLKSGNGVLLKGGSEARETNKILFKIISDATKYSGSGIPNHWAGLLETRADVNEMLKMHETIDLIIPRGSNDFVKYIMDNTSIPVMGHADGICSCYIDKYADIGMAVKIVKDSKTQYTAVCNAVETVLVHKDIASVFLPELKKVMDEKDVKMFACPQTLKYIDAEPAAENSWHTEYLDFKMSVRTVENINSSIEHINKYGSGHTDCIITNDSKRAAKFLAAVDSGNVFWNCSTRFSDGYRYGFGAEVGISTGKLHARGPVGLEGLVIYKYKVIGNGHIVGDYANHKKEFKHIPLEKDCPI